MYKNASEFYNAWSAVMSPAEKQLLCTSHVDRNWKLKVGKLVEGQKGAWRLCLQGSKGPIGMPRLEEFSQLLKAFMDSEDPF